MYHGIPDRFLCKKMSSLEFLQDCSFQYFGGVREIRTLAGLATSNDLAKGHVYIYFQIMPFIEFFCIIYSMYILFFT